VIIAPARDAPLDRETEVIDVVRDIQEGLARVGVRSALLHQPARIEEHDVDLAVDGVWRRVWPAITSAAAAHGYRPVLETEYDVGDARCVVLVRTYRGEASRVALDTCADTRGIGMYAVPMGPLLDHAVASSGIRHADAAWGPAYVFAKHVWKRTVASAALDRAALGARTNTSAFEDAAAHIFGRRRARQIAERVRARGRYLSESDLPSLLRGIHVHRVLHDPTLPLRVVRRWISRVLAPNGMWIVICGVDGSGKSTIASRLLRELVRVFPRNLHVHGSAGPLPRPGAWLRRPARDASRPHGADPHGRTLSALILLYLWLDHLLGYVGAIRPAIVRSGIVVTERGYDDLQIDPRRYRLDVPSRVVRALGKRLPRPDLAILLLGEPSILHQRKPELDVGEIERMQREWRLIARDLGERAVMIDAGQDEDSVMASALDAVVSARSAALHGRFRRGRG
jgi:thymidylate kinase